MRLRSFLNLNLVALLCFTVSVGNVGQLAVDLIISTLRMNKAGFVQDESITPVVGSDPYTGCFSSRVGTLDIQADKVCR